jgi:membrane dipeptidase
MRDMKIVDMHCDTLLQLRMTGRRLEDFGGHISMEKLRRGGALLQCFAVFTPTGPEAKIYRLSESPWDFFNHVADIYDRQLRLCASDIAPVLCMSDLDKNMADGKVSAVLTLEDAVCLDGEGVSAE